MTTRLLIKLLPAALVLVTAFQIVQAQPRVKSRPSQGSITGSYRFRSPSAENSLDAQLLPSGKVKIYLYASWIGSVALGNVRNGEIRETLPLKNNVAVYESGPCRITIRFGGGRAVVTQNENDCGFGLNVLADGSYVKRSRRVPKFDF
jgi:hypothetical protein